MTNERKISAVAFIWTAIRPVNGYTIRCYPGENAEQFARANAETRRFEHWMAFHTLNEIKNFSGKHKGLPDQESINIVRGLWSFLKFAKGFPERLDGGFTQS